MSRYTNYTLSSFYYIAYQCVIIVLLQEDSPPPSPMSSQKPLPSLPTQAKKGHRPSAPLMPKPKPLTPPKTHGKEVSPSAMVSNRVYPKLSSCSHNNDVA